MSLLRPGRPRDTQEQRDEKARLRALRLARTREARAATRMMVAPEPKYGIYVSVGLVLLAVYSYLSTDVVQIAKTVHGKTKFVDSTITHPAQAIVLFVFALAAASTIYWQRRLVTGITYIVAGFFAVQTPFPKAASGAQYVVFLVPAGYAFWMLMFRMNKEQKAWLNEHYPPPGGANATGGARGSSRRAAGGTTATARAGRGNATSGRGSSAGASSRSAQIRSGRYTPPRAKSKAAPRKPA